MADEIRTPMSPAEMWQVWYDAANQAWAKALEALSGNAISPTANLFSKGYQTYAETFRQVAQEYASNFHPATRPDVARVAELVAMLDERVAGLDAALGEIRAGNAKLIGDQTLAKVERNLAQAQGAVSEQALAVEHRLDQLTQQVAGVAQTLVRMETSTGEVQSTASDQAAVVGERLGRLEQRLDRLESAAGRLQSTLDQVISALEKNKKTEARETAGEERKAAARRAVTTNQPADQV